MIRKFKKPYLRTCDPSSPADGPLDRKFVSTASIGIRDMLVMRQSARSIRLDGQKCFNFVRC